jgi:hypothetical protein
MRLVVMAAQGRWQQSGLIHARVPVGEAHLASYGWTLCGLSASELESFPAEPVGGAYVRYHGCDVCLRGAADLEKSIEEEN